MAKSGETTAAAAKTDAGTVARPLVLGIESSCDETAVALVDARGRVLAERVASQVATHAAFGGVVPEVAARAHLEALDPMTRLVLEEAGIARCDIDAVAATTGPGLVGGLLVGAGFAKALAFAIDRPFIAVNHLEAHALSVRLVAPVPFPFLLLLVSGGHCQTLVVEDVGRHHLIGTTIDDAVGEAFDKAAKLLGLGYPGGPAIERAAAAGDPRRFELPRPMLGRDDGNFSFSGLKTALRTTIERLQDGRAQDARDAPLPEDIVGDLAAAFQAAAVDCLVDRTRHALDRYLKEWRPSSPYLVVAGGVAANRAIRAALQRLAEEAGARLVVPPPRWCTDNAAMVAWTGVERLRRGLVDPLCAPVRARWPLDAPRAGAIGGGRKGPKA